MPLTDGALQPYALTVEKFLDHAAKWHPRQEVVTRCEGGRMNRIGYASLRDRVLALSNALAGLGTQTGERVATLAWNTQAHLEAWYAIMGMGAVCHTLNPRLTSESLAWMLEQSGARILIASADLADLVQEISGVLGRPLLVLAIDGQPDAFRRLGIPAEPLEDMMASTASGGAWHALDENAPCGLCFTSGTTGAPKGVTYTHRGNYLHTLRQLQADVAGITSRDVILTAVPMFHANAWGLPFSAPASGAKLVLPGRHADGSNLADLIEQEGVTLAAAVPTVWLGLVDYLDASGRTLLSLNRVMVGGSPMPAALMRRMESAGIEVQTTWGMTELSPLGTATPPGDEFRDGGVSGNVAIGLDLMLSDADGEPLPDQRNREGHLWAKGHSVVEHYLGDEKIATRDGWFPTGDLARIDDDGRLSITGRAKDLIKSGGEWINPAEIEAVVSRHPDVSIAAVIARSHPRWGERPILVVELKAGAQPADEELLAGLDQDFARWWVPDEVIRLSEMPLAATGKVDKLRLRTQYSRG